MQEPAQRRLAWEGSYNIRDLAGLAPAMAVSFGAGRWCAPTTSAISRPRGQAALVKYGIGTIIDVRSAEECATWPHAFSRHTTIRTVNIPIGTGANAAAQAALDAASDLAEWGRVALQHCKSAFAQLTQQIAHAPPGGVLIHCHAGKDRTGLAVALVLALVGVEPALVTADYAASADGLQPLFAQWLANVAHDAAQHAALAAQLTAHPETMLAVLDELDTRYGGVDAYLEQCGVGEAEQSAVRQRLCEEAGERR